MTTLGTFPLTESRTGYVHTAEGPKHQTRPWNEGHRFGSHLKIGDK